MLMNYAINLIRLITNMFYLFVLSDVSVILGNRVSLDCGT